MWESTGKFGRGNKAQQSSERKGAVQLVVTLSSKTCTTDSFAQFANAKEYSVYFGATIVLTQLSNSAICVIHTRKLVVVRPRTMKASSEASVGCCLCHFRSGSPARFFLPLTFNTADTSGLLRTTHTYQPSPGG